MSGMIVHSSDPIVLLGGADLGPGELNILSKHEGVFVAADSGADHLLRAGLRPSAVIGDLDSLSDAARAAFSDVLHRVDEQETVDFEKALDRICAPLIYGVGFGGGRVDHMLTALHVLGRNRDRPVVLIGAGEVTTCIPSRGLTLDLPSATPISLMPLEAGTATLTGVNWPFTDQTVAPMGFTSPSNVTTGGPVHVNASHAALLSLPIDHLSSLACVLQT